MQRENRPFPCYAYRHWTMITKLTFHEIQSLGNSILNEQITTPLPCEILEGVSIEDVSGWLTDETLNWVAKHLGVFQTDELKNVRFALVHRYIDQHSIRGSDAETRSGILISRLIELIQIIRPMRQYASIIRAERDENGS